MENIRDRFFASVAKGNGYWAIFSYPFLIVLLALLYSNIKNLLDAPAITRVGVGNLVVASGLLLNHIAFGFPWPYRTRVWLRLVALVCALAGLIFFVGSFRA